MPGIELTSRPGKTFTMTVKNPTTNYATLATGIAMSEISSGRYRATYAGSGIVWVEAVSGATMAVGFADFNLLQDNGYAEVTDVIIKSSVTVLPVVAIERERQKANIIPLFVGELTTTTVAVRSASGATVVLDGKTLSLEIETQQRTPVATIAISATGSNFVFTPTAPVTSTQRTLEWALWDAVAKSVICHGTIQVGYVPILPAASEPPLILNSSQSRAQCSQPDVTITDKSMLIVSFGESNAGGVAVNDWDPSWELEPLSEVNMWNVNTQVFEPLDIGTNNNLDHAGLTPGGSHGWELGLANRVKAGAFVDRISAVHYLQTGQGASIIANWNTGGAYWSKFLARTTAAKAAMPVGYKAAVWATLGINDAIQGSPLSNAAFKAGIEEIIGRIKTQLPSCKIYFTRLPSVNAIYDGYSTQIDDIATADADVTAIDVANLSMQDANHYGVDGLKLLSARFVSAMVPDFPAEMVDKSIDWASNGDAGFLRFTAGGQYAHLATPIDATQAFAVYARFNTAYFSSGIAVVLDDNTEVSGWGAGTDLYIAGMYHDAASSTLRGTIQAGTAITTDRTTPTIARLLKSGNDVLLQSSVNNGTTWTTKHTFSGVLVGKTNIYLKALSFAGAGAVDVWLG